MLHPVAVVNADVHKPNFPIKNRVYTNPEGVGYRRTPLNEIKDIEIIADYRIENYDLCNKFIPDGSDTILNCPNRSLFNGEHISVSLYLKRKSHAVRTFILEDMLSIIQKDISENLDLGVIIQRVPPISHLHYDEKRKRWLSQDRMNCLTPITSKNNDLLKVVLRPVLFYQ